MGFLDNTTNNILIDASISDLGRQFLARNDGSFSVVKFAIADDGVNYGIIKQYGRTVGKEKIEKNSPVLEALTLPDYELKNKLISISNPNLIRLPSLTLTGADVNTSNVVTLGRLIKKSTIITASQSIASENSIDVELRDQTFLIQINNLFLQLQRTPPDNIDGQQVASYLIQRSSAETAVGGSTVQFNLSTRNLTESQFTIYGQTSNKNVISTYAKISGLQSGASIQFRIDINKTL